MNRKRTIWLVLVTLAVAGVATMEYWDRHPASAVLPMWIRGEFGASAERYAGRTVTVDSSMIRFSHGESADVLPIEWIEEIRDARSNIRILDLHVRDGDRPSTIRLIAAAHDSSFRLQTMPDVAWRALSDREARAARMALRERAAADTHATVAQADAPSAHAQDTGAASAREAPSDTVIGSTRFVDRDPAARDELAQVVASCRRYGCRIGVSGLQPSRFAEFSRYLRGLGADSVALTSEPSSQTTMAMLEIPPARSSIRR